MVAYHVTQLLAHSRERTSVKFFDFLLGAKVGYKEVDLLVDHLHHLVVRHFYRVNLRLVDKKFLHSKAFGNYTVRVTLDIAALRLHGLVCLLDFTLINRLVANPPGHLLDNIILGGSHYSHSAESAGEY